MQFSHRTLKNGLNVFSLPIPDSESVVFNVFVKAGTRNENQKSMGIAHFLEHLFYKGSKKYPRPTDIFTAIDAIGGDFNALTSKESTEFYIRAAKKHADFIFEITTDMLLNPLLAKEEIEKEKGVVIEEINMYQDNPGAQVEDDLEKIMWPQGVLGRSVLGTKETVRGFTRARILDFKKRHYVPANIILGFSGVFDEKKLMRKIADSWGRLPSARAPLSEKNLEVQKAPELEITFKDTRQAHFAIGFKGFDYTDPDSQAASLIGSILGGGSSSRLFVEIREKRGLAYFVSAYNNRYMDAGNFTIHAGLKIENSLQALGAIMDEIRRLKSEKIPQEELSRAKEFIKGRTALFLEDSHDKLEWLMERFAFYGETALPKEVYARYDTITAEDILRVSNRLFKNDRLNLAAIGPFKDKAAFKRTLVI